MVNSLKKTQDLETREKILMAANSVFVRHGIAAARTQEIAKEAGVNKALIHYYFGTKEELARTVLSQVHSRVFPKVFQLLADSHRTLEEKIREIVAFQLDTFEEHPYIPGFVASELFTNPQMLSERLGLFGPIMLQELQQQLDKAAERGEIRRIDAAQFVASLLGATLFPFVLRPMLERIMGKETDGFKSFVDERRRTIADFFMAGLRP